MNTEELLSAIDRVQYSSCDNTIGLDIKIGQCNECPTCRTIMGLRNAVLVCQDWYDRGSFCVPINEVVDAIQKEIL